MSRTRVFAIANQDGGVGKTTTAINLAAYLAAARRRTLLIDLSPTVRATIGLGVDAHRLGASIYEVLVTDGVTLIDVIKTDEKRPHLALAPAKVDLTAAEIELIYLNDRERRLINALAPITDRYDYILIDCPPSLGLLTVNALTAADGVIVPLPCEYFALEGMQPLLKTIKLVRDRLNPRIALFGVVLTKYDPRSHLGQEVVREMRGHFAKEAFTTMIPAHVRLIEAPSYGLTILEHEPRSPGALAYKELAEEVIARAEAGVTSQAAAAPPPAAGTAEARMAEARMAEARMARLEQQVNGLAEEMGALGDRVKDLADKLAAALDYTEWVVAFLGRKEEEEQAKKAATQ